MQSKLLTLVLAACSASLAQIAIRGERVYTMAGDPVNDGVVLIRQGKIERVGPAAQVPIPAGYRTLQAKVVTPGLVDAHSVVGLAGYQSLPQDQEQLDRSAAAQPELRAIDAYDPSEPLIAYVRGFGVTTLHTGHAPGMLMSGQTMIVKTTGRTVEEALITPLAMYPVTLGESVLDRTGRAPGRRAKAVAMLRAELIRGQEFVRKGDKSPSTDLHLQALARVVRGEIPLLVNVHQARDILTAIRIGKEFNIKMVLDGAGEAYLVTEEIKAAGYPVIVHATMQHPPGGDGRNLTFENPAILRKAGIPFAIQSGYAPYVPKTRVVLFEAGMAAANGLTFDEALASITIDAARILGIDRRAGSLEPGKDGDVALYDGDPFEFTTHCIGVVSYGQIVSEVKR
jgi:imidazolonepropionase-like amidohydrolase